MSLRDFIEVNGFKTVEYPCSVEYEIASHVREVCETGGPILKFKDLDYEATVIGGVYATRKRIKSIFTYKRKTLSDLPEYPNEIILTEESDFFSYVKRFSEANERALSNRGVSFYNFVKVIAEDKAPVTEVTIEGDDVDLYKLPICIHNEKDAGKFITAGVNVVKWISGVTQGLGIHRMMVVNKNTLSCLAPPNRRIGLPYYEASKKNKSIKMAVIIGAPPEVVLGSQSKIPPTYEKYTVAACIGGKDLRMVRLEWSDLFVPAESELVLECESLPNSFHDDTPFAEYPGVYSSRTNAWKVKVVKIHYRRDYMYQTILTGKSPQEDSNLCAIPYATGIYDVAKNHIEVTDISVFLGNCVFDVIVCVNKRSNSEVQNLLYTLLGSKYLKSITIMDKDLRATEEDWRFAWNTRVQPNRDIIITNLALGASLDPSSPLFQSTSKIAIDATIPIGRSKKETAANKFRHTRCDVKPDVFINKNRWT